MTDKRTTIVLGVIAAVLLAFIVFVERRSLSTGELESRRDHVLRTFVRAKVTRVELVRGDEPAIVFEREQAGDEDQEDAFARWRLSAPVRSEADQDAVDSFLGALEWLMATRELRGISDEDRRLFGLDSPRFVVRYTVEGERYELRVGGEAPEGQEGVYAAVVGEDVAYVVGRDFVESIDHDVAHFRDKDLFPDDFYASDARSIRVEGAARPIVFEKEGDRWHVREPVRGWANAGAIDRLVRMVRDARAERFVAEEAGDLSRYGLDEPWRELVITRAEDARGTRRARLRVGERCGEHGEERYALSGDDGPIVCVLASALAPLELPEDQLREARLFATSADAVERIVLEAGGERLELARTDDDDWEVKRGGTAHPADDTAIADWLRELRETRAEAFEPIEGDAPGHGLGSPAATLTITRSDAENGETEVLRLGAITAEGAWLRRGDEPVAVRADARVAELLRATPLRFRARDLVDEEAADARAITIARGGSEERAVRTDGGDWRLEAPIEAEADRVVVREVARQLAELRAERFVAERPAPEHGLGAPRLTVSVRFQESDEEEDEATTVTLRVGAEAEDGGAYAQLAGEDAVFVITRGALEGLDRPLVSLDLLTVEASTVRSLRIEREGRTVAELRREDGRWMTAEGAAADADRTQQLLDRLGTLRAAGVVRYGTPDAALGLDPPATRVTVTREDGSFSIDVGADQGQGDDAYVPVRRSDIAVVYRVRPDLVSILRTYAP